jgi:hypothetical protein
MEIKMQSHFCMVSDCIFNALAKLGMLEFLRL